MGKRGPKPKPKPIGAPLKLNDDLIARLVKVLESGAYVETAVAHVGVSKDTYYRWMKRGAAERAHVAKGKKPRKREALFLRLSDAVERAIANAEVSDLDTITAAAAKNWQAAAWKLERRNPSRWGRTRHEVTGADGGPLVVANWAELVTSAAKGERDE